MTDDLSELLAFAPVPLERTRCDGWKPRTQRLFILALVKLGGVAAAAKACSMSPKSAYRLRARPGAEAFAEAWDIALRMGQDDAFERAIERGVNGFTVPVYRQGRLTGVRHGYDNRLLYAVAHGRVGAHADGRADPHEAFSRATARIGTIDVASDAPGKGH